MRQYLAVYNYIRSQKFENLWACLFPCSFQVLCYEKISDNRPHFCLSSTPV